MDPSWVLTYVRHWILTSTAAGQRRGLPGLRQSLRTRSGLAVVAWALWKRGIWGHLGARIATQSRETDGKLMGNWWETDGKLMGNWWETDGKRRFYIKSLEFRTGILQHVWIHLWTLDRSSRNSWSTFSKKILGFTISETPWYLRVWKCGVV